MNRKLTLSGLQRGNGHQYQSLQHGNGLQKILLYIESEGNYLTFYETGKKVVTRMTVAEAMRQLPGSGFMRIHKSYIVSLAHIDKIERHQVTIGKTQIPLAGTYRDELLERVK